MTNFSPWSVPFLLILSSVSANKSLKSYQLDPIPLIEYKCPGIGFFPHEENPQVFYECVTHPGDPEYVLYYSYMCPGKQCFDKNHELKCSLEACHRNHSSTEKFACLKEHLQKDAQLICQDETLSVLGKQLPRMVEFTAYRGDPFENLKLSLRDANLEMRENYAKLIEHTGKNVLPLMVLTDAEPDFYGVGGVYKVYYKDGSMKRIIPVSPAFEIYKSLSHMVLGVFSIIAPYFRSPKSLNWQQPLRNFQHKVRNIQYILQNPSEVGETSADERRILLTILRKTALYIDKVIKEKSVDIEEFHRYAMELAPLIEKSMEKAARAHAQGTIPALQKLKDEMGEEEWKNLHVIIPTVWPVSLYNIRLQALEKVMSFDQIRNQVLIVEGSRSEAEAKTTLGRVVADRAVAQLVWGEYEEARMKDHIFSLSTRRDLLSSAAYKELNKVCQKFEEEPDKPKCPFAGRRAAVKAKDQDGHYHDLFATMTRTQ